MSGVSKYRRRHTCPNVTEKMVGDYRIDIIVLWRVKTGMVGRGGVQKKVGSPGAIDDVKLPLPSIGVIVSRHIKKYEQGIKVVIWASF